MGRYTQVFTPHYDADPDRVWAAPQRVIDDMDGARLGPVRHAARELEFETGVTLPRRTRMSRRFSPLAGVGGRPAPAGALMGEEV